MITSLKKHLLSVLPTSIAGRLRIFALRRRLSSYKTRVVEHRYGADVLKVFLADGMAEGWYDQDWPELPEISRLRQTKLRPGATVFDIGAHQGVVAMMQAVAVTQQGKVIAVEPNPHNVMAARKNRDLNDLCQITIVQAAVSDRRGTIEFNQGLNGQLEDGSGTWGRFSVDSMTIDELAEMYGQPAVVFIDIEGAECLALNGSATVLQSRADFFVEVHVNCGLEKLGGSVDKVLQYFPPSRYELLIRAEGDAAFHPLVANDPLLQDRFFLLALNNQIGS